MPPLDQRQFDALGHIAEHARKAVELASRYPTPASFVAGHWEAQFALVRCIEVIGEASNRLGRDYHAAHPEVPWRDAVGMRNRLIHGYEQVSLPRVWTAATQDLPGLLIAVEALIATETVATPPPPIHLTDPTSRAEESQSESESEGPKL